MWKVYAAGVAKSGQLGNGSFTHHENLPRHGNRGALTNKNIAKIACGGLFTLVLDEDGVLYSFGKGRNGRLGNGDTRDTNTATPVKGISGKVVHMAAGTNHAIAITENGRVYSWGTGRNGCTGLGSVEDISTAKKANIALGEFRFQAVKGACGQTFTLVLGENGSLISFGSNYGGCLGRGKTEKQLTSDVNPAPVIGLEGVNIVDVACGVSHSCAVSDAGKLYTWGDGQDGCLGHGNEKSLSKPKLVEALSEYKIIAASCSSGTVHKHTLCLTDDGRVFSFGSNYKGTLGIGFKEPRSSIPLEVTSLSGKKVVRVAAGGIYSCCATETDVYTWGCGSDGRLGHPEAAGYRYLFKEVVPRPIEAVSGRKIRDLSAHYYHTAFVTECDNLQIDDQEEPDYVVVNGKEAEEEGEESDQGVEKE